MKQGLVVFLAICAFAIAMVPKDRRAGNTEEHKEITKGEKMVCDHQTPCAWSVYEPHGVLELNITNSYCSCGVGTSCVQDDNNDRGANAFVYRCREPGHDVKADN